MAILAVPTLGLVVLGVVGVAVQAEVSANTQATESEVGLVLVTQSLVHELQRERGLTNGLLAGEVSFRPQVINQRRSADTARGDLERALDYAGPAPAAVAVRGALGTLAGLGDHRAEVDSSAVDRASSLEFYTSAINGLTDATLDGQQNVSDAVLLAHLDALRALGAAKEGTALERGFLNGVFAAGTFRGREYTQFNEIRATKLAGLDAFAVRSNGSQQAALDAALRSAAAASARDMEQRAIDGVISPALGVDPARWWVDMTRVVDELRGVQQHVGRDAAARAAELRTAAVTTLVLYVALAVAALLVAAVLAVVAARSITRPLRLLAADARDAATVRLPAAVARIQNDTDSTPTDEQDLTSETASQLESRGDEIADVARALAQVQRTAAELAGEQAVLRRNAAESMASLARRNQNLLRRQLGFISQLERDEDDAESLADLFELDHLATRMRRNAESLLVLIGERSPRRWSEPVAVGDIIRAALSEVEEYRRVTVRRLDHAMVVGSAGAELAHLLAELLENALSYSPPDREVEVYGQSSDGANYVIAIVDHGIGMADGEIEKANGRLAGGETFLVAPTRYLGHYVIGRLARRLGIDVRLQESPVTGITARVLLPVVLLSADHTPVGELTSAPVQAAPLVHPDADGGRFQLGRGTTSGQAIAVLEMPEQEETTRNEAGSAAGTDRTRNGLVKRVRNTEAAPAAPHEPVADPPPHGGSAERTRASVTAFRAGFDRRAHDQSGGDGR
jgi:signal transduction histidine kinase